MSSDADKEAERLNGEGMSKHTPTPWMARPGTTTGAEVVAKKPRGGDYVVARCGGKDREANAAFIVRAVNAHEALVEALRFYADDHQFPNDGPWGAGSTDFGRIASEALAMLAARKP